MRIERFWLHWIPAFTGTASRSYSADPRDCFAAPAMTDQWLHARINQRSAEAGASSKYRSLEVVVVV
jgi:hypothetical protein